MKQSIKTEVIIGDDIAELEFEIDGEETITIRFASKEIAIADWSNIRKLFARALAIWPKEAEGAQ